LILTPNSLSPCALCMHFVKWTPSFGGHVCSFICVILLLKLQNGFQLHFAWVEFYFGPYRSNKTPFCIKHKSNFVNWMIKEASYSKSVHAINYRVP
jgi:hypothetical protein